MAAKWTIEQQKAIDEYGGNILVSAAAGSGKTAVLVERILKIIKEKFDVDKLLVVTFTKAAASELKERLYLSLQKELEAKGATAESIKRLSRQQTLLSKSYITTIDSFCKTVVSSNPIESGFDSSFRLADEEEIAVVKAETVEKILEKHYGEPTADFLHLVENLGSYKNDKGLAEEILSLYAFSQSNPSPDEWLVLQKESFEIQNIDEFSKTPWYTELVKDLSIKFEAYYDALYKLYEKSLSYAITEYEKMLASDLAVFENITACLNEAKNGNKKWKDIFDVFTSVDFEKAPTMGKKALAKYGEETFEVIEFIQKERKNIKSAINKEFCQKAGSYPEAPIDDIKAAKSDMHELIDLTLEFSKEFNKKKQDKHILTFEDISHGAFNVLSQKNELGQIVKSDVAKRYSNYFEEVYIDEYQDTNELQDAILYLVSRNTPDTLEINDKSIPNMFMVGDVKQSIYGFRQARPDIFTDKYKSFAKGLKSGKLIVLNKNFRSRQNVIESVNNVFEKIMTEETCGINYTKEDALHYGATFYPEIAENTFTELHLINKSSNNENSEPKAVAQIIKNLIDNKFQVFDKGKNIMRDITYRDIVILMRAPGSNGKSKQYVKEMKLLGIPAFFAERGGFFANAEINILISFMKVIDNPLQDIHFVATLRNIYGFSDTDIAKIKLSSTKNQSYFEMCNEYSEEGELKNNLQKFLQRLDELRKISRHVCVSELLWMLMHENHFYEHVSKGPMGELHGANLNILYAKAIKYDKDINKGLFRFLYFFDDLKKQKGDMDEATLASEEMNVVRIVSIHKSKGLEYPVVILSDTAKAFNDKDTKKTILKHRLLGLGPTCYLEKEKVKYPSVMKYCVARRLIADNMAEEMRVLYVAMTRASEKLIITGTVKAEPEVYLQTMNAKCSSVTKLPLTDSILNAKNYLDWITMCKCVNKENIHVYSAAENDTQTEENEKEEAISVIPVPEMTFYKEKTDYDTEKFPAKISVSELKRIMQENDEESASQYINADNTKREVEMTQLPDFKNITEKPLTSAQIGTAIHICMQLTDYSKIGDMDKEQAKEYAEELILTAQDKGFLNKQQADNIDISLLTKFYLSTLAKRIAKADKVMKEIPFTQLEEIDGQTVAVQGVIDCLIKEGDEFTVIDFKTDEKADEKKYEIQLLYYANAVQKTYGVMPKKVVYFIKHNKEVQL